MQSGKNPVMDKTFNSSNNVCGVWYCLSYNANSSLAYWGSFVGLGICIILSGKTFQTKSRKSTLLIAKFIQNSFENALTSNSLITFYAILAKSFCSDLMELDASVCFWQSVVSTKFVFTVIAFKRQVLFFATICTVKFFHRIIKNSY